MKYLPIVLISLIWHIHEVHAQVDTLYQFDKKRISTQVKEGTSQHAIVFYNKRKVALNYLPDWPLMHRQNLKLSVVYQLEKKINRPK